MTIVEQWQALKINKDQANLINRIAIRVLIVGIVVGLAVGYGVGNYFPWH